MSEKKSGPEVRRIPEGGKFRTLAEGTTLYSGVYPEYGEVIGRIEKDIITVVLEGPGHKRQSPSTSWLFFPTTYTVEIGPGREIPAWVAKIPGQQGFVKI